MKASIARYSLLAMAYCVIFTAERARFEKFSKTLIVVEASDRSYEKFLGHRLEIVPTILEHGWFGSTGKWQ